MLPFIYRYLKKISGDLSFIERKIQKSIIKCVSLPSNPPALAVTNTWVSWLQVFKILNEFMNHR